MGSQMPWDTLRGDTIRVVIRELGFSEYGSLRKDEMIDYLRVVEHKGLQQALTLQKKRKATQKLQSPAKRIRPPQDSPLKKITRNESRQMQQQNQHISSQSGRFTLDCVLVDRASTLSTRGKRKEPQSISDREESPEIELLSHSPEIPLSPLPSEHDVAPTSEIGEQELILPSSDAAEEVSNRSVDILFGPPSKSVKTYGKRKVGRPRKSLG